MLLNQLHLTFFLASLLLGLSPGPDNLFVLLYSAQHGARSGLLVVLGLCTGLLFHTSAVAFGLAALLAGSSWALILLKSLGAVYLLWLAWQAWRAPVHVVYLAGIWCCCSGRRALGPAMVVVQGLANQAQQAGCAGVCRTGVAFAAELTSTGLLSRHPTPGLKPVFICA